jgi:hypothetical protein
MAKPPTKTYSGPGNPKNANPRGDRLTSKHGKAAAHHAPEKRVSSKVRGR